MSRIELKRNQCSFCGADLHFDVVSQMLNCSSCGRSFVISPYESLDELLQNQRASVCPNCNGVLKFDPQYQIAICESCNIAYNVIVEEDESSNTFSKNSISDYIIPFSVTESELKRGFIEWAAKQKDLPTDFFDKCKVSFLKGAFIPTYFFDCSYTASFTYSAGYYYTETEWREETVVENGHTYKKNVPHEVSKTRYEPAYGNTFGEYKKLVNASNSLLNYDFVNLGQFIEGQLTSNKKYFDERYLSGFSTLPFDIDTERAYDLSVVPDFKKVVEKKIKSEMLGDCQKDLSWECSPHSEITKIYLPMYIVKYRYEDKNLVSFISGSISNCMIGTTPKDLGKSKRLLYLASLPLIFCLIGIASYSGIVKILSILSILLIVPGVTCYFVNKNKDKRDLLVKEQEALREADNIFTCEEESDVLAGSMAKGDELNIKSKSKFIPAWARILIVISLVISVVALGIGIAKEESLDNSSSNISIDYDITSNTDTDNASTPGTVINGNDDFEEQNDLNLSEQQKDSEKATSTQENSKGENIKEQTNQENDAEETTEEETTTQKAPTINEMIGSYINKQEDFKIQITSSNTLVIYGVDFYENIEPQELNFNVNMYDEYILITTGSWNAPNEKYYDHLTFKFVPSYISGDSSDKLILLENSSLGISYSEYVKR